MTSRLVTSNRKYTNKKRVSAVKKRVCTVAINNVYKCNYKVLYTVANIKITYQFVRSYIDIALTARLTFVLWWITNVCVYYSADADDNVAVIVDDNISKLVMMMKIVKPIIYVARC